MLNTVGTEVFRRLLESKITDVLDEDTVRRAVAEASFDATGEREAATAALTTLMTSAVAVKALVAELFKPPKAGEAEQKVIERALNGKIIIKQLGKGSFGTALLVYDKDKPDGQRVYVLKVLMQKLGDPDPKKVIPRFKREHEILTLMQGTVTPASVGDMFQEGGHLCIAQEYIEGCSLEDLRMEAAPAAMPKDLVCAIGVEAALRLQELHRKGIVHRDVKPHNLMLNKKGEMKIIDPGLATAAHEYAPDETHLTQAGQIMGTPTYMSPEQINSPLSVTPKADVYSLGCTLYHLLTARVPYIGETHASIIKQHGDPDVKPDVSMIKNQELAKFLLRMMEKDPNLRPDMQVVAHELWRLSSLSKKHPDFLHGYATLPPHKRTLPLGTVSDELDLTDAEVMYPALAREHGEVAEPLQGLFRSTRSRVAAVAGGLALAASVVVTVILLSGKRPEEVATGEGEPVARDVKKDASPPPPPEKKLPPAIPGLEVNERGFLQTVKLTGASGELVLAHDEGVHVTAGSRRVSFYHPDPKRMETMLGSMPVLPNDIAKQYGLPAYVYADCGEARSYVAFVGNVGFIFIDGKGKKHLYSANAGLLEAVGKDYDVTGGVNDFFENADVQRFLEDYQLRGQIGIERGSRMANHLPPLFAGRDDDAWRRVVETQLNAWKGMVLQKKSNQ